MVLPKIYAALLDLSALRDQAHGFASEAGEHEAARFLDCVQVLETKAVRLLDLVETRRPPEH
ncbi:MAG TPA: hypothetical protein VF883_16300 [Thermoanaerobaculia bacterium]|jgi:hypothetical protein